MITNSVVGFLAMRSLVFWFSPFFVSLHLFSCATAKSHEINLGPSERYSRNLYRHWIDEDRDCQNTRAEVLINASQTPPKFKTSRSCVVVSGKWTDPYSGQTHLKASKIDIDHIVPLKQAHESGASRWPKDQKQKFANDSENLLAVTARYNRQKGAKGPTEWMPPDPTYHCRYLKQWMAIKTKYRLAEPHKKQIEQMTQDACQN